MIQRIQTVFLALVAVCMFTLVFTPFFTMSDPDTDKSVTLSALKLVLQTGEDSESTNTIYLAILGLVSSAVAVGSIFQYKNRLNQIKLNFLNTLLLVTILGFTLYFLLDARDFVGNAQFGSFGIGFYCLMAAFFFNMLANRFIRKDEKLVKSADRFR